ncbi:ATP-dependent helicase [Clostridia bacterium]|nr:ATP-dependent helicase [Clostridia bacterium]
MSGEFNEFKRLSPFIQEYIYGKNWNQLKEVQAKAITAVFDSDKHILISAGTASGKTEAAFFPVLSQIEDDPSNSVAILYIAPLKALINDQFQRLDDLLKEADIKVWRWHGDVSAEKKKQLTRNPSGILQITPESLEALMVRKSGEIVNLFRDLRYIVIDEVHSFMGTDRGGQLLCQITKIERFAKCTPRRIGLSATIGDIEVAADWMCLGSVKDCIIIEDKNTKKNLRVGVDWYTIENDKKDDTDDETESKEEMSYNKAIYNRCKNSKSIIFTNSRGDAETVIADMKRIARILHEPDIFHVHHGSISKTLREEAEFAMREQEDAAVTSATLTLELGIDIGDLERVLQIGAPYSCSSFLQRIGRSGRRTGLSEMYFTCLEKRGLTGDTLMKEIPWELLQIIAIIELTKDKWMEPINNRPMPFSLLYHQTMSMLVSMGEMSVPQLARNALTLPPFSAISKEDYLTLLRHLIRIEHLQKTEENTLIIGLKAEPFVNHFSFYSVFADEIIYKVIFEGKEIGTVNTVPPENISFCLAGKYWIATEIDLQNKVVFVKRAKRSMQNLWMGGGGEIHTRIIRKMKQVLLEDVQYTYLSGNAKKRLEEARMLVKDCAFMSNLISRYGENTLIFAPWVGSKGMRTFEAVFKTSEFFQGFAPIPPLFYGVSAKGKLSSIDAFENATLREFNKINSEEELMGTIDDKPLVIDKYDEFLPAELLKKQYIYNMLDIGEIQHFALEK